MEKNVYVLPLKDEFVEGVEVLKLSTHNPLIIQESHRFLLLTNVILIFTCPLNLKPWSMSSVIAVKILFLIIKVEHFVEA